MSTPTSTLTQTELKSAIVLTPLVVTAETTVMEAIAKMSETRTICAADHTGDSDNVHLEARSSCVLVMEGEKVVGIMTERDVVRLSTQQRSLDTVSVREVMVSPVITLREADFTDLFSVVNLLQQRRIRHLPILDRDDHLLGMITHESLRQLARPIDLLRLRLVSEVMTANVVCAEPSTSMLAIAQTMADLRVGSVLIVEPQTDPEGNSLQIPLGIITERDIVQFQSLGLQLERVEVQMVMSAPVFAVHPNDTLMLVQQIMEQRSIRRLVVIGDQGELLGVVTQTSLLNALNPLELYTLSKILEQKVSQLEAEKLKLLENYNAELEHQVEQRTADLHAKFEREQLIAKISTGIAALFCLPEILNAAVQELRSFLGCDRMLIWQFESDGSGVIVSESVGAGWRASLHEAIDDPCFHGDITLRYSEGRTIAIANIHQARYPNCYVEMLEAYQVKSNLVVPIHVSGKLWGLLIGHQCDDYRVWEDADLILLDEISVQIAISIQQAAAHEQVQIEQAERQRTESALRESEQRFRGIFDNMFQLIGLLSPAGILLESNQASLTAAGIEIEDVVGQPFWETYWWQVSPETQLQLKQAIARAAKGEFIRYEVEVLGINQTIIPIDFSLRPIFNESGQIKLLIPEGRDLREAKRRELELKQSEQRFTSLATAAPVGIFRTDNEGNCLYVNKRWCEIAGLSAADAAGFGWISGIHPNDRELVSAEWNDAVQANRPFYLEYRFLNNQGQITWVLGQAEAERDERSEIIGYVGTITDISDRKQAEAALQQLNQELEAKVEERTQALWQVNSLQKAILDGADYAFISTDLNGLILTFNEAAERMLGYSASEVIGKLTPAIIHEPQEVIKKAAILSLELEQDIPIGFEVFVAKARLGIASEDEWTYIRKDGSRFPVLLSVTALKDINQQIIGFLGIAQDISDRKQTELERQQLLQELSNFKIALDRSAIVAITDAKGIMTNVNDLLCEISGYTRDELLGQTHRIINSGYHPPSFFQDLWRTIASGEIWRGEICNRTKNGSLYWMESTIVPFLDEQGRPFQYLAIRFDITQRKQAELAIQESETRFRYLADHAPVLIWMSGLDKLCFHFNKTWLDFTGRTMEQELGNGWVEGVHPDDFHFCLDVYTTSFDMRQSFEMEYRLRRFDGEYRWMLDTGIPRFDADGEFLGYIGTCTDISDRKAVEQEILEKQKFIQKIAEASPNILYLYDLQEQCNVYSNREIASVLGYTPTEIQSMGGALFANLMHPEDLAKISDYYQQIKAAQEGEIFETEYRMLHANGEWRWLYSRDTVFSRDDLGQIKLTIGTAQDISDRKQSEQQLKQQLTAIEATVDGIAILKDDCYIYLNSSHVSLFGYTRPEDLLGKNWKILYSPEEFQHFEREVFPVLGANRHWEGEAIAIRKDGTTFIEGLSLTLTEDGLLICVCRDVSARKEQEEELLNLSTRLTLAAKSAAIGIWDWDVVQNTLTWDDRMYEMYGIKSNQFTSVYEAWSNSLHPDDRSVSELALQQAIKGEKDFDPEFRVVHPDGTIRYIQGYAMPQHNAQGEVQRMVGINFDITDRKLAESQILQTTAQLQASNQELEAFAYSVSHDLRSPLRAIDGYSNALIEDYYDKFDDEARDYFERIRRNVKCMGMLIDDLLRLSRVSRSEMQYSNVNLSALVQEQVSELQVFEPEREVEVVILPNIFVSADLTLMRVVISNLVQNAWKFTSHHATSCIEFGIMEQEDQLIYFIRDDGAGFDMAFAKMLFGVFQRLHNTNEFAGTGIGLASVQRAIHRHGGKVWAEGFVEKGATIYFTVPHTTSRAGG
ncbi:MAG: PAS domain S-box protein [Pseudanabaena sp. M135S2SP2A07QC]|nr:PAS domain S-box protein [Pseudanabaena sp. M090S1SP2A07QC]MCA6505642.1 PAS domain S-box protein [Pseudanabaena sp. M172S2SP2A07QC]MCA6520445.1 PAS domain S-box protein [Pseudanabaena sp. M051S1SP2A07QC]MCA6526407.1 PAS domain S-box protein [Pseudanabaena sp. M179S2SP2A07QC]MCA6530220.1 PAS domain S-box protein [Pseudanabaena sp. M125S2SP2A07QC]MCA6534861.1 PAS domain S-box protein [Pseudanabaena sp. M176S2SP2A07QC]MCA6539732.1 PAS domain S-box protein [Pseudanabaena sp. M037S2SP2A07QC]MC